MNLGINIDVGSRVTAGQSGDTVTFPLVPQTSQNVVTAVVVVFVRAEICDNIQVS